MTLIYFLDSCIAKSLYNFGAFSSTGNSNTTIVFPNISTNINHVWSIMCVKIIDGCRRVEGRGDRRVEDGQSKNLYLARALLLCEYLHSIGSDKINKNMQGWS